MKLLPRLLAAQGVPLLILLTALIGLLIAMSQITVLLREVKDQELELLHMEAELHRRAWALEVAMRHGESSCIAGSADAHVARDEIRRAVATLRQTVAGSAAANAELRSVVNGYIVLAESAPDDGACAVLASPSYQRRRWALDERLTNVWSQRMERLHQAILDKDGHAQRVGAQAFYGGLLLAGVAVVLAVAVSLRLASSVTTPLSELTDSARRLGRGDFAIPIEADQGPAELVAFARELEVMRGRLAELESLKQSFIASVSHEMRTPLSKLREALALLSDQAAGPLTPRQSRIVEIGRTACERQIRTVTSLLDLSRLRAGTPLQLLAGVRLDGVLRAAVDYEKVDAEPRGVTVRLTSEGPSPLGRIDAPLLERAVANLVRNAVNVSKRGQVVTVTRELLDLGPAGQEGGWARVRVKDEGPGVPEEVRRSIFQPFVTHAVPQSPKTIGVGLGLSLAREVARAHGGELELGEGEGGAEFLLWVPLLPEPGSEEVEGVDSEESAAEAEARPS